MADNVSTEAVDVPFVAARWEGVVQALRSRAYGLAVFVMAALLVAGVAAGVHAKMVGSLAAYGASREIPWGILISTYVFFVVTSTGLCLISSIGHVFGVKGLAPISKRAVYLAISTLVAGFFVIFFEIENPFRMAIYNVISPNLTSNIWWMGTLYGMALGFMSFEFVMLLKHKYRYAIIAGFIGVVADVAANSNLGAVFGMLGGNEFWYGPFMPVYFIASAMMSGTAAIMIFTWLAFKVNGKEMDASMKQALEITTKIAILMIAVILFFTAWKFIIGFGGSEATIMAIQSLLIGPYAFSFWVFELGIGMVIPLLLLIKSQGRQMSLMAAASALMIFGIFFMRYDLVVVGQVVPLQYGLSVSEYPGLLHYSPSIDEILVVLGGLGMVGLAFLLGERIFDGHKSEAH